MKKQIQITMGKKKELELNMAVVGCHDCTIFIGIRNNSKKTGQDFYIDKKETRKVVRFLTSFLKRKRRTNKW